MVIVDDQHLFTVLSGYLDSKVSRLAASGIATTSSWYFRLGRAVAGIRIDGALSGLVESADSAIRASVHLSLRSLPPTITSYDFRDIVPVMSAMAAVVKGNFINLEALAVGIAFGCPIVVSTESRLLLEAAEKLHVEVLTIPLNRSF
jgi:hypothetical protein